MDSRRMSVSKSPYVEESTMIKMVFVGDAGVGKTSILARYVYKTFQSTYYTTIGIDSFTESITVDNKPAKLIMWDTAGMERYRSLVPQYIKDAQIAMIVYDVTDKQTLCNAKQWIKDVKEIGSDDINIVLVGNKLDRRQDKQYVVKITPANSHNSHVSHVSVASNESIESIDENNVVDVDNNVDENQNAEENNEEIDSKNDENNDKNEQNEDQNQDQDENDDNNNDDNKNDDNKSDDAEADKKDDDKKDEKKEKKEIVPKKPVDTETGLKLATDHDVSFYEVSAKTGEQIDNLFEDIVRNYLQSIEPIYDANDPQLGENVQDLNKDGDKTEEKKNEKVKLEDKNVTKKEESSSWCCFPFSYVF